MSTTIRLNRDTKKALASLGAKDESYDSIIRRLLILASNESKSTKTHVLMDTEHGTMPVTVSIPKCVRELQYSDRIMRDSVGYLCEKNNTNMKL